MTWLSRLFLTFILLGASASWAVAGDECRLDSMRLPWSEIQANLHPRFLKLKFTKDEMRYGAIFEKWAASPAAQGYHQEGLLLSYDIQKYLSSVRHPSVGIRFLWSSILLSTEQYDMAFRTLSRLPSSDLQKFMRAESQSSPLAYHGLSSPDPKLSHFIRWRKAEIDLKNGNLTEAWQSLQSILTNDSSITVSSPFFLKRTILQLGISRLDPSLLWAKVPPDLDREWLSICILSQKAGEAQQQSAYRQLIGLDSVSDRTFHFALHSLRQLRAMKASLPSHLSWSQTSLDFLSKDPKSPSAARSLLLEETFQNIRDLSLRLNHDEGQKLARGLALFVKTAHKIEQTTARRLLADLYESIGSWNLAAIEYRSLWQEQISKVDAESLAELWLKNSKRAAPTIDTKTPLLVNQSVAQANLYLEACDANAASRLSRNADLKDCASYSILFAMNQNQQDLALRRLWLYVSRFPKDAHSIVAPMLSLFSRSPDDLLLACEKFLLIPQLQSGPSGTLIRDELRRAKFLVAQRLATPLDKARALVSFAENERPHALAFEAMDIAIDLAQSDWRLKAQYLRTYQEKFSTGSNLLAYTLKAAKIYESHFALNAAREVLHSSRNLAWTPEHKRERDDLTCRLDALDRPVDAIESCTRAMTYIPERALELAKQLARFKEATALHSFITSEAVQSLALNGNMRSELLAVAFHGTAGAPNLQTEIRTQLYDLYTENYQSLSPDSRRLYSIVAFDAARKSLSLFLDMPIFASVSADLLPSIQAKRSAFRDLESLYSKVLQTKDPYWGASALADLASANLNLSDSLNKIAPIEGLDFKALDAELRPNAAQWTAQGKSLASTALKTLETFNLLHEDAHPIFFDMQKLRGDLILWEDRMPSWRSDELF